MKKEISNYRYYVLLVLLGISFIFVIGEETHDVSPLMFVLIVILDKAFGIGIGYIAYRLYTYWDRNNRIPLFHLEDE